MKLIKELYIHNHLSFTDIEINVLADASQIISAIQQANIHSVGKDDIYLHQVCDSILSGISELLNNYSNEYPGE